MHLLRPMGLNVSSQGSEPCELDPQLTPLQSRGRNPLFCWTSNGEPGQNFPGFCLRRTDFCSNGSLFRKSHCAVIHLPLLAWTMRIASDKSQSTTSIMYRICATRVCSRSELSANTNDIQKTSHDRREGTKHCFTVRPQSSSQ